MPLKDTIESDLLPTDLVKAKWPDGSELYVPGITVKQFNAMLTREVKLQTGTGILKSLTHKLSKQLVSVQQRVDRKLLIVIFDQGRQVLMINMDLFGPVVNHHVQELPDSVTLVKAVAFITKIADRYAAGEIAKDDLKAVRDKMLIDEGLIAPSSRNSSGVGKARQPIVKTQTDSEGKPKAAVKDPAPKEGKSKAVVKDPAPKAVAKVKAGQSGKAKRAGCGGGGGGGRDDGDGGDDDDDCDDDDDDKKRKRKDKESLLPGEKKREAKEDKGNSDSDVMGSDESSSSSSLHRATRMSELTRKDQPPTKGFAGKEDCALRPRRVRSLQCPVATPPVRRSGDQASSVSNSRSTFVVQCGRSYLFSVRWRMPDTTFS